MEITSIIDESKISIYIFECPSVLGFNATEIIIAHSYACSVTTLLFEAQKRWRSNSNIHRSGFEPTNFQYFNSFFNHMIFGWNVNCSRRANSNTLLSKLVWGNIFQFLFDKMKRNSNNNNEKKPNRNRCGKIGSKCCVYVHKFNTTAKLVYVKSIDYFVVVSLLLLLLFIFQQMSVIFAVCHCYRRFLLEALYNRRAPYITFLVIIFEARARNIFKWNVCVLFYVKSNGTKPNVVKQKIHLHYCLHIDGEHCATIVIRVLYDRSCGIVVVDRATFTSNNKNGNRNNQTRDPLNWDGNIQWNCRPGAMEEGAHVPQSIGIFAITSCPKPLLYSVLAPYFGAANIKRLKTKPMQAMIMTINVTNEEATSQEKLI